MRFNVGDTCELEVTIAADDVAAFAKLSGDFNPVHMDESYAARSPAGGRVVHGILLSSYVSNLIGMHLPGMGALWACYEVDFVGKVRIGDRFSLSAKVTKTTAATRTLDLGIEGFRNSIERVLVARARVVDLSDDNQPVSSLVKQARPVAQFNKQALSQNTQACLKVQRAHSFTGRTALITGATGVIGQAIAMRLAQRGERVILWGRNEQRLDSALKQLCAVSQDVSHIGQVVELADIDSIKAALSRVLEQAGAVHSVVHLAQPSVANQKVGDEGFADQLSSHLQVGVLSFSQIVSALLPKMLEMKHGNIVSILTQYVFDAPPEKVGGYVAAKSALWGLTKAIAVEAGPKGIRANAVSPGMVNTPYSSNVPVRMKQLEEAITPVRRMCTPEDIANTVEYLTSENASFINGMNLALTGGRKMP